LGELSLLGYLRLLLSFRYDGDWGKGEYWIGYDSLKKDFNWFFDGLEKAYHMVLKNQRKHTGAKQ